MNVLKVTISRTVQVKQYEPITMTFEAEFVDDTPIHEATLTFAQLVDDTIMTEVHRLRNVKTNSVPPTF